MLKSKFKEQGIVLEDEEDRDLLEYYAYCEYHYESIFKHVDESIGFSRVEIKIIREVHVFNRFLMDGEPFDPFAKHVCKPRPSGRGGLNVMTSFIVPPWLNSLDKSFS